MSQDLTALQPEETEKVRNMLAGLINTLRSRQSIGGSGRGLIQDEEYVLNSLQHPERGDVMVSIVRDKYQLHVFLANRRDPKNPLVIMDAVTARDNPARRPLDNTKSIQDGEYALFLNTFQDRELLSHMDRVDIYSVHFGLNRNTIEMKAPPAPGENLATKPLENCTREDKWKIYKKNADFDNRVASIEKELFGFPLLYARHKQPAREETIILTPNKTKEAVGQLIRDIYPYGVRVSLRRDYPKEHKQKLEEVRRVLGDLAGSVGGKRSAGNPEEYSAFLDEAVEYLNEIVRNDPEFSNFS